MLSSNGESNFDFHQIRHRSCSKIDKSLMQEFTDELLVMASLDHPNVVAFYGASLQPPHLCLAMELCDGSLYDLLHRDRAKLSTYERLQVRFTEMCLSLCLFFSLAVVSHVPFFF